VWAPEMVWTFWIREKSHARTRIQNPDRPARSLVAISSTPLRYSVIN